MKKILLLSLMVLIPLPSIASEGNYVYRIKMDGVKASENTAVESIKKKEMCKNESIVSNSVYNYGSPKTYYYINNHTDTYPGLTDPTRYQLYIDGDLKASSTNSSNVKNKISELGYAINEREKVNHISYDSYREQYTRSYYSLLKEEESENYGWCVDNGYETAN